jgi:hypothetical protein
VEIDVVRKSRAKLQSSGRLRVNGLAAARDAAAETAKNWLRALFSFFRQNAQDAHPELPASQGFET